jgi:hypothetical protein
MSTHDGPQRSDIDLQCPIVVEYRARSWGRGFACIVPAARSTRSTGRSSDIIVEAFFNDQEHLLEFVSRKLGALKGVTGAETSLILKVAKFSYEWEIP